MCIELFPRPPPAPSGTSGFPAARPFLGRVPPAQAHRVFSEQVDATGRHRRVRGGGTARRPRDRQVHGLRQAVARGQAVLLRPHPAEVPAAAQEGTGQPGVQGVRAADGQAAESRDDASLERTPRRGLRAGGQGDQDVPLGEGTGRSRREQPRGTRREGTGHSPQDELRRPARGGASGARPTSRPSRPWLCGTQILPGNSPRRSTSTRRRGRSRTCANSYSPRGGLDD